MPTATVAPTTYLNFIDGEWRASRSGRTFENINPADTRDVVGLLQDSDASDVDAAVQAAQKAFPGWAAMPAPARGKILLKAAAILEGRIAEMADLLSREEGKTIGEAKGEVTRAVRILEYFGGEGARMSGQTIPSERPRVFMYTIRRPIGVVALIAPWNFPIAIPTWKMAPALVSGNAVVFKPASQAPLTSLELVRILEQAGIPKGVLNLVTGSGSSVGTPLVAHPQVRAISFTGSDGVGKGIAAVGAERLARVQLEMGGKNPTIVLDDADLELAVRLAVMGGFALTGQSCTATSRVIVEEGIADRFAAALAGAANALNVGDGLEDGVQMGPAVSEEQLATDLDYVRIGREEGAELLAGGGRAGDSGHFLRPTVFDGVDVHSRLAQEEIFGPVIGIVRARDLDDAIFKANAVGYGLAASVVTNDLRRAMDFVDRIEAGVVKVNEPTTGLALQAPFGGFKQSSANTFKEQGPAAVDFYTRTKTVYVTYG
jgi:aldehyde dehydrogenase (NAD+)